MKVVAPETAISTLREIIQENGDKPHCIRVYFAGVACSGPSFGLALDEQKPSDCFDEVDGIKFIMDKDEYEQYGDITIEDTGFGFMVVGEKIRHMMGGGCSGCSGCH